MDEKRLKEFESIFYPRSIAVVGATNDDRKAGHLFLRNLLRSGFKGSIYPVNHAESNVLGLEAYPSVKAIPDEVDFALVAIPRRSVLDLLDDCAAKKIKVVHFFTGGFSELGDEEGIRLEEEMLNKARKGGLRIIGPNCAGVYSPAVNIPCGPEGILGETGSIGFICQSGSLAGRAIQNGNVYGLRFSKAISFGNGCDLDSTEFLEYFAVDPETRVISAYLEGVKDGHRLFRLLKDVSSKKPLIVWKGGKTEAGVKAAASHTGAIAGSNLIWTVALKQSGVIEVNSLDELIDTLLAFQQLSHFEGRRVTIISGLIDGGGGQSVVATDACASSGLEVSPFSEETSSQLAALLGKVGSILHNPLDVSQANSLEIIQQAIEVAITDQNIDLAIIQESIDFLTRLLSEELIEKVTDRFIDLRRKQKKPIVLVLQPGSAEAERLAILRKLSDTQIPVFPNLERAAKAIANVSQYFNRHSR